MIQMIIAAMFVRTGLSAVREAINGYIRDGVIRIPSRIGWAGETERLEMQEYIQLGSKTCGVWGVNQCAIIAENRADDLTELKLLAVKRIFHNDEVARDNWKLLGNQFEKAGQLINPEDVSREGTVDIAAVKRERRLIEGLRPELPDEREYKKEQRKPLRKVLVGDRFHVGPVRTLNAEERRNWAVESWQRRKREVEEEQAQWDEIHALMLLTTEQATKQYLMAEDQAAAVIESNSNLSEPGENASRNDWYRYRYEMKKRGSNIPHKLIARKVFIGERTSRNGYSKWLSQNGLKDESDTS
jgi:hypothetical protein